MTFNEEVNKALNSIGLLKFRVLDTEIKYAYFIPEYHFKRIEKVEYGRSFFSGKPLYCEKETTLSIEPAFVFHTSRSIIGLVDILTRLEIPYYYESGYLYDFSNTRLTFVIPASKLLTIGKQIVDELKEIEKIQIQKQKEKDERGAECARSIIYGNQKT